MTPEVNDDSCNEVFGMSFMLFTPVPLFHRWTKTETSRIICVTSRRKMQGQIHTSFLRFTEIGRIFHKKYTLIFLIKDNFQVEISKMS